MERVQPDPLSNDQAAIWSAEAERIQARRAAYAVRIVTLAGLAPDVGIGSGIAAALASIPREKFLGTPPWRILSPADHAQTTSEDAADLYDDVLVSLGAGKGLNNGQPSLHAVCLAAAAPAKGERVVHVGAGTGYYTAMLATLVGSAGQVDAYEIEPELAESAVRNLAEFAQVHVHLRSGAEGPLPECDVLYVNAGSPDPLAVWLDALKPGARLLFPMAPGQGAGEMLLVTRRPESGYDARFLGGVEFVACIGTQDQEAGRRLVRAFRRGHWRDVKSLHRFAPPDASCWCAGRGWWLSTKE